ncbi:hypothetical protein DFH06DRAFT_1194373 [Mycena polygramma]|nr:hypothetical protein DFH06DRAFT_1194373 [Mycena polygramma]
MAPVPSSPPAAEMAGTKIVAYVLHWGLFGALTVQLYLYYLAFPKDHRVKKCLVYTVYAIELAQTILLVQDMFSTFAFGFGDLAYLANINLAWSISPMLSGVVAFIGQSFYAYRVFLLSKSRFVPVFIIVVSMASCIGALLIGAYSFGVRDNLEVFNTLKFSWAAALWLSASALSDITIVVAITYSLLNYDAQFRHTRVLVSKIIRLTVETGSVTALCTLITLALFYALPKRVYYTTPAMIIPTLYANSMLAVLNSRLQIVGGRGTSVTPTDIMIASPIFLSTGSTGNHAATQPCQTTLSARKPEALLERESARSSRSNL